MARLLICGDRRWAQFYLPDGKKDMDRYRIVRDATWATLDYFALKNDIDVVMEGCAPGADRIGEMWAQDAILAFNGIKELIHFPADWGRYGKSAGIKRNLKMRDEGRPDFVVALHDDIENSKGTKHMVKIAREAYIPVTVYTYDDVLNAVR